GQRPPDKAVNPAKRRFTDVSVKASVKPRQVLDYRPNSIASLAVLLLRKGVALPRTPSRQRGLHPSGLRNAPSAFLIIIIFI
ncbi:MAG: hypothetical protein WBK46_15410, partial [Ruminococcus flavefaciens]